MTAKAPMPVRTVNLVMPGKHGTIQREVGPEAWDVRFHSKRDPSIGQFVGFHTSELEVLE